MTNPVIGNIRRSLGRTGSTSIGQRPSIYESRQAGSRDSEIQLLLDEIKKLDAYAEQKVELACQMMEYDRQNESALSEVEANDIKNNIIKLEQQITSITREIDAYCNNDERYNYFEQIYKHKLRRCESE